ncbi:Type II secretion system protein L [Saliniradius amylolyticus]|uniref:Type II secretion system protein L n=1 Tax=Saliniradius amylolyticus TaxID=2183582 RepID=A0A2S2DYZ2_9ALTE|nr:type II secretion system protein GspL [Saliniradius amylolyticus]AWL10621.1 Type II secretion system protein L [Saliniradius amylolyticus]
MSEQLVLRLGSSQSDPIYWLVWSQSERDVIASGELPDATALGSLKDRAGERPVIALAPGSDVLLRWLTLPVRASRKVLAAIPYMLEEELSTDVDSQLFALGPKEGERQAIAVVDKALVNMWLNWLDQAGLYCDRLLPDILALPHTPDGWTLLQLEGQVLVRQDQWKGIQGESEWLLPLLEGYAGEHEQPVKVTNYSDHPLPESLFDVSQPLREMPMQVLAQGAIDTTFNLLQGPFKPKKQKSSQPHLWRPVAVLAGIALAVTLFDKGLQAYQLSQKSSELQQQITQTFRQAFPDVTRVVNVRAQLNQQLAKLEQGGGQASLLTLLSQLQPAFSGTNIKPQTLRFDAKRAELRMQVSAERFESIERFRQAAQAQGFEVEQGAINNTDDGVISSLAVRS